MRTAAVFVVVVTWVLGAGPAAAMPVDCEPARCAVQSAIQLACPCDGQTNHGRYVSCVAHVVKRLSDEGQIPINCRGKIRRCAARSTCGKAGFVTCRVPVDSCDLGTGTCTGNPAQACATDLDCGSRCSVKRTAELCQALGGVPGASGSCCSNCVTP